MRRWLAWNLWFPLQEFVKGHPTRAILREMEAADRLAESALRELQRNKLRDLLEYSYRHVPYVRKRMQEAGIGPGDIAGPEDLPKLPLLRKADVRNHRMELRSDCAGKLSSFTTGGSTGEPLIFDLSRRRTAARVACRIRVGRWWGVSIGDPEIALWGSPVELSRQDRIRRIRDWLLATRLLSAFEMNEARMSEYLDIIERQGCRQIFGYPSAVYLLCRQAQKQGRDLRRLGIQAVFVTGEVLFPYQRELISDVLNCPVANGYGGRDSGFLSHECPQGGMHILADAVVVEIVDGQGRPAPPGEPGEIVATDLYSHEFPFIRYATGDIGVASARRCSCGRALPLLERIDGRSNDSIVAPDGRIINSIALVYPLREIGGIEQYRICQKSTDRFHVQIVVNEAYRKEDEERIRVAWAKLLRAPVQVSFEYLPGIPAERQGKFRHITSEVPASREIENPGVTVSGI